MGKERGLIDNVHYREAARCDDIDIARFTGRASIKPSPS
jgi:hypothetical protein